MLLPRVWIAVFITASFSSLTAQSNTPKLAERPAEVDAALKDLDGYFPFNPPGDVGTWQDRAQKLRMQLRVALGIWPEPTRTPLNATIHGRVERDDYSVEKVAFEAMPGFYVTGNLYRPKGTQGRVPGILCPHGHWPDGRFMHNGDKDAAKLIETGAERFDSGARSPLQARCVQLARMGCVVFHYDMIGNADSQQLSLELAHKFAKQRPEMNSPENWGLFSPQAEANAQSVMGLQTWSGIRALDFLQSLPDVDAERLAVTGASGGATQTLMLGAVDPRVRVAFPAVMVSTAMQGGCTCENASLLRIGTGNVEIASLFAPKPMGMTAANDWTKELPTKGFPQMQQLWALLGAPEKVALTPLLQFPHNYNAPSRAAMYGWMNTHLALNLPPERLQERDFQLLTTEEMSVWDSAHPAPEGGPDFERKLLRWWQDDAQRQLTKSSGDFRRIAAAAMPVVIGADASPSRSAGQPGVTPAATEQAGARIQELQFTATPSGHLLRGVAVEPKKWNGWTALWLDQREIYREGSSELTPQVAALLTEGARVVALDLVSTAPLRNGRVKNPREAAAYTYGYNRALLAQQAADVLSFLASSGGKNGRLALVSLGETAPLAAAVCSLAGDSVSAAAVDTHGFRFGQVTDLWSSKFLPVGAKYGDMPGMLALGAPRPLFLSGENTVPELLAAAYESAGGQTTTRLKISADSAPALDWLKELFAQSVTR